MTDLGKIQSGKASFIWSREHGGEIFGHIELEGDMRIRSAGFWRTKCPLIAARRAGLSNIHGPSIPDA